MESAPTSHGNYPSYVTNVPGGIHPREGSQVRWLKEFGPAVGPGPDSRTFLFLEVLEADGPNDIRMCTSGGKYTEAYTSTRSTTADLRRAPTVAVTNF